MTLSKKHKKEKKEKQIKNVFWSRENMSIFPLQKQ